MSLIQAEALTKTYDSGDVAVHALRAVDLSISAGEHVAIMGSSGSGKSTLMNLLGCLDTPSSGRYLLAGTDVGALDRNHRAEIRSKTLGFVFQSFNLLPRTSALENVELPLLYAGVAAEERKERALFALGRVGMTERAAHQPNQLSGGQQQRVAIARAIVNEPRVILADEPTGNLDTKTSNDVMEVFASLVATGITIVIVTHEPDVAEWASRVIEVRDGRIVDDRAQAPSRGALS